MELTKAKQLVQWVLKDPHIQELYKQGDKLSSKQTKHDINHAYQVLEMARKITDQVKGKAPKLDEWTCEVIIPLAAFLHDIGRAINVENHAAAGASWSRDYLSVLTLPEDTETLPRETVKRVARIVANHRSESVLNREINDPAWAIVVIADKCVGDEDRVRPFTAFVLSILTFLRMPWLKLRSDGDHDRVNYAIKEVNLVCDEQDMVLQLSLDRRVCGPQLVYGLYGSRFWACGRAAKYLGYQFRLEFNGERYAYDKDRGTWNQVPRLSVG